MTLAQKSPVKQQMQQSPNGKALPSPGNNAVLKESYIPKRLLMGDMDMVDHGGHGGMLGCGSTTSDTSESTSLRYVVIFIIVIIITIHHLGHLREHITQVLKFNL